MFGDFSANLTWLQITPTEVFNQIPKQCISFKATSCMQSKLLVEHIEHSVKTIYVAALWKPKSGI